ncbi:LysR substrate-binding domain-containing protein [Candidimonas nitroreducens]|uniref:Transcriptional regulator CysB n=1 Tax=Candidimonas nitroreducens TaxID=683354 RepID=A0A225M6K9_9BURK|nr:LysR substrate-binding domain-containing protein [Candidimonas nitroreducens]OWT56908.1 transcriptional regulator CysB [Candidimonas nitroreducens]
MNLNQLRSVCEIVNSGLKISQAAGAMYISQPSVTRHIKELEQELGFEVFVRSQNRVLAVTPRGEEIVRSARRILQEIENIHELRNEIANSGHGEMTIATTHTHAKYILPPVVRRFIAKYPNVSLTLHQGNPKECSDLVVQGQADMAICSNVKDPSPEVCFIPCYKLRRIVLTGPDHPLLATQPLTLEALARYPLVSYDGAYGGRRIVDQEFSAHHLVPSIALTATDAEVSKEYVKLGLGVAIFAAVAFDPKVDSPLRTIPVDHLFQPSMINLVLRKHSFLRGYIYEFMHFFAPGLNKGVIEEALFGKADFSVGLDQLPFL